MCLILKLVILLFCMVGRFIFVVMDGYCCISNIYLFFVFLFLFYWCSCVIYVDDYVFDDYLVVILSFLGI